MARMRIAGYDEEMRVISPSTAHLGSLAELQYQTGWKMAEVEARGQLEFQATLLVLFLTLHQHGHRPRWEALQSIEQESIEWIQEPSDNPEADVDEADPTTARTDSDPGAGDEAAPAKASGRPSRSRTGSTRASSSASRPSTK